MKGKIVAKEGKEGLDDGGRFTGMISSDECTNRPWSVVLF